MNIPVMLRKKTVRVNLCDGRALTNGRSRRLCGIMYQCKMRPSSLLNYGLLENSWIADGICPQHQLTVTTDAKLDKPPLRRPGAE